MSRYNVLTLVLLTAFLGETMKETTQPTASAQTSSESQSATGGDAGAQVKMPEPPDVKKIVSALLVALEHKFGRKPTAEELAEALQQKEDPAELEKQQAEAQEQEQLPKILSYRLYYGMRQSPEGQREPDPEKVLFYENQDGNAWFDVDQGSWLNEKPAIVDHLPQRCLGDSDNQRDIFDAIMNGVMDDDDFAKLQSRQGMLDNRCERAWELTKRAKEQMQKLEEFQKSTVPQNDDPLAPAPAPAAGDNMAAIMSAAGLQSSDPVPNDAPAVPGAGGGPQMVQDALGPGVEPRIRRWIAEEVDARMDEIVEKVILELQGMVPDDGMEKNDPGMDAAPTADSGTPPEGDSVGFILGREPVQITGTN